MSTINMVLTGKGGVGKTLVAVFLAQFLKENGSILCFDTDPTNQSFAKYEALGAKHIKIVTDQMHIDKSGFDELVNELIAHEGDSIIDNGGSSFLPLMAYLLELDIISLLKNAGKRVRVHAVLIGEEGLDETMITLQKILEKLDVDVVVWENELFGPVQRDGRHFIHSQLYMEHKERICGIVKIRARGEDTFKKTMHLMTSNKLTFTQVKSSLLFGIVQRARMAEVQRDIYEQLRTL